MIIMQPKLSSNIILRLKLLYSICSHGNDKHLIRSDLVNDHLSADDMMCKILLMMLCCKSYFFLDCQWFEK